jgi:hypothetical protein
MNSRRKRCFVILLAGLTGLASGFAVRWIQRGDNADGPRQSASMPPPAPGTKAGERPAFAPNNRSGATVLAGKLEEDLSMSAGVTRWLYWMTAVEEAKLADFPRLARMAQGNSVALRLVGARWIELNPRHLFEALEQASKENGGAAGGTKFPLSELGHLLFEEWSKSDPEAAIAALSGSDGQAARNWRYTVANAVMSKDPERGLRVMSEWRMENYGTGTKGIETWAAKNPRHAAEFALAHPAGYATQNALEVIGKTWAQSDPEAALAFAAGLKDKFGASLATGIVKEWANADLAGAAGWLTEADQKTRNRLSGQLVEIWARTDTAAAMDWVEENLSGSSLDEAVGSVLKGVAEKSVTDAAALVAGMDASQARARAALAVARKWFPDYNSHKPADPAAVAWLSALDPVSMKHVIEQMQWQWGNADPRGFADFLTSPAGASAPAYAFESAAREMARQNPQQAFDWAAKLPADYRLQAGASVFREWQNSQPAAAMEWIHKLPADDPRRDYCFSVIAREYVHTGPEADQFAKALASGGTAARNAVQNLSLPDDVKQRIADRLLLR